MQLLLSTLLALICVSQGAPNRWAADSIVYQDNDDWSPKGYTFGFETLLGSTRKEKAILKENEKGNKFFDVQGEYSYAMPDGTSYTILYKANDRGYQQSPPIMLRGKFSKYDVPKHKWTPLPSDGYERQNEIENGHKVNISLVGTSDASQNNSSSTKLITDEELQLIFDDTTTVITSTTESVETTTMDLGNETDINGIGNRVGLPSDVIGSLLG